MAKGGLDVQQPTSAKIGPHQQAQSDFIYDPIDFENFKKSVRLLSAEWGVNITLFSSEDHFKEVFVSNAKKEG